MRNILKRPREPCFSKHRAIPECARTMGETVGGQGVGERSVAMIQRPQCHTHKSSRWPILPRTNCPSRYCHVNATGTAAMPVATRCVLQPAGPVCCGGRGGRLHWRTLKNSVLKNIFICHAVFLGKVYRKPYSRSWCSSLTLTDPN